jgi:hypothetical protein
MFMPGRFTPGEGAPSAHQIGDFELIWTFWSNLYL